MPRAINVTNFVRLQLKTGYMKTEPSSYRFLIRYPPLARDSTPLMGDTKAKLIPYVNLLKKLYQQDPVLADETVYPEFWQDEPIAMTIAKKQYELLQKGLSESEALIEARKYANSLENKAYEELISVKNVLREKGSSDIFISNPEILQEIMKYRALLKDKDFKYLDEADQGEMEYFVQTKVLKWNEVERNRRMRDPIFLAQFERVMQYVFPEINAKRMKEHHENRESFKKWFVGNYGLRKAVFQTSSPFYYEDYCTFFNKIKEQPYIHRWNSRLRDQFSRWIIETLASREIMEKQTDVERQFYLDQIRKTFFPMTLNPERSNLYNLPSSDELRAILFANKIGYKTENTKLFVRRFYYLPKLLFPEETMNTKIIGERYKSTYVLFYYYFLLTDKFTLICRIGSTNLEKSAILDDMISASEEDEEESFVSVERKLHQFLNDKFGEQAANEFEKGMSPLSKVDFEEEDDGISRSTEIIAKEYSDELSMLLREYFPTPTNALEREREALMNMAIHATPEDIEDKYDAHALARIRYVFSIY